MGTLTDNLQFQLPTIGGDDDTWGDDFAPSDDPMVDASPGLNGNWEKADQLVKDLQDRITVLSGGLAGPYYETGDGYRIIGSILECWGRVDVDSGNTVIPFPKSFSARPSMILIPVCEETPPSITAYTVMAVQQLDARDLYQATCRIQDANGPGYITSIATNWRAIGVWDGV